jgi:hypothetical protein
VGFRCRAWTRRKNTRKTKLLREYGFVHGAVEVFAVLRRYAEYVSHRRFAIVCRSHIDVIAPLAVSKRLQSDDAQLPKEQKALIKLLFCAGSVGCTFSDAITHEAF